DDPQHQCRTGCRGPRRPGHWPRQLRMVGRCFGQTGHQQRGNLARADLRRHLGRRAPWSFGL
ncbi:hypothetical protein CPC16_001713, partial [Podila verticillata]